MNNSRAKLKRRLRAQVKKALIETMRSQVNLHYHCVASPSSPGSGPVGPGWCPQCRLQIDFCVCKGVNYYEL